MLPLKHRKNSHKISKRFVIMVVNMSLTILLLVGIATTFALAAPSPQSNQLASQWAQGAANSGQLGKPQFHVSGGGAGNNGRNWGAHGNVGVGMKAWESQNRKHSVGVGANYGQSFGRFQGHSWKSRPDVGIGAGYTFRFGGGRRG